MTNRAYEDQVVPQVREFLRTAHLESKLKCLVTFYGVPLRIDPRVNTPEESDELASIRHQLIALPEQLRPSIESVEAMAKKLNADFAPDGSGDLDHLIRRRSTAFQEISNQLKLMPAGAPQAALAAEFFSLAGPLLGDKASINRMAILLTSNPTTAPADRKPFTDAEQHYNDLVHEAGILEAVPNDAASRQQLRQIVQQHFGLLQYVGLLRDQADYLDPRESGAAFDSELAMVEWNVYPHRSFFPNPLNYAARPTANWPTLMVSRLDAPTPEIVKSMITNSIKVEQQGLTGQVVIDSLGVKSGQESPKQAGYGIYDQTLRDLYELIHQHSKLKILFDQSPDVLPPNSATDVALYVGWYSVRNYVPACKFNEGAVGYHIASYELVSLRNTGETGWVHGLLNDGVVGTLGPVAEPFLGTFPRPDEYFPLLLTGKFTLAEVYWKTCPAVSWMMACVGDPLYTPYLKNPQLAESDLPARLRTVFKAPVTVKQ